MLNIIYLGPFALEDAEFIEPERANEIRERRYERFIEPEKGNKKEKTLTMNSSIKRGLSTKTK